jgi:hypothetical protein
VIYGFCGGYFGRDSYGNKTVIANGRDWVTFEEDGVRRTIQEDLIDIVRQIRKDEKR